MHRIRSRLNDQSNPDKPDHNRDPAMGAHGFAQNHGGQYGAKQRDSEIKRGGFGQWQIQNRHEPQAHFRCRQHPTQPKQRQALGFKFRQSFAQNHRCNQDDAEKEP